MNRILMGRHECVGSLAADRIIGYLVELLIHKAIIMAYFMRLISWIYMKSAVQL